MRKLFTLSLLLMLGGGIFTSCNDDLDDRVGDLEKRMTSLEEAIDKLNSDIAALQQLIDGTLFIKSVVANSDGSYTITFVDREGTIVSAATVGNGLDGSSSEISVRMDADGNYYWTLNGEWLTGTDGGKLPVSGADGVTPQFKIAEEYWYISYDGGASWTRLGKATGEGQDLITAVEVSDDGSQVVLTLSDGTQIKLDLYGTFNIVFEGTKNFAITAGGTLRIPFTLTGAVPANEVEALPSGRWLASVEMIDPQSGRIVVTAPDDETTGRVIVLASDGDRQTVMRTLTFRDGFLSIATTSYPVSGRGGTVEVGLTTNLDRYRVRIPADAPWITQGTTRAAEHPETLVFNVAANDTDQVRSAVISVTTTANVELQSILITQMSNQVTDLSAAGKANCYIVPAAGAYKFYAATRGNSDTPVEVENPAADFLWVDGSATQNLLLGNIEYDADEKCIYFLASGGIDGNAVVVLYDSRTMRIAYSWHLWFVEGGVKQITAKTSGTWMDRNLGARGFKKEDTWKSYGLLWQWGRKDPFIGSDQWNFATSSKPGGKESVAFQDMTTPNYINPKFAEAHTWWSKSNASQFETIDESLAYPMRYTCQAAGSGIWTDESVFYTWRTESGAKGVYDPCPAGYHVPSYEEFADSKVVGSLAYDLTQGGTVPYLDQEINNGAYYTGNGTENETWLPAVPYRGTGASIGKLLAFGYYGTYWTSTASSYTKESGSAKKYNSYVSSGVLKFSSNSSSAKAGGYTIRCKKD